MGIIKKLLKRDLTPEQQEIRSQKEKEWAEKCYKAGEEFGEKIGIERRVNAINEFGNKYPKTFFSILLVLLTVCFALNYMFSSSISVFKNEAENIEAVSSFSVSGGNTGSQGINNAMDKLTKEMHRLEGEIEGYVQKDTLTRQDSLEIRDLLIQLKGIHDIMGIK